MPVTLPTPTEHAYLEGRVSFIGDALPEELVSRPMVGVLKTLQQKLGERLFLQCLNPKNNIPGPREADKTSGWVRTTNMTGINVRTLGSFWHCVPYALSLPAAQDSIHLLPIWEPGVVGSLYGMVSFHVNPEFFNEEMSQLLPHLNTVEHQLKVVVNLLHAMGKTVGMDVIPHTDRYSEIVLANPNMFEWLQRKGTAIVDHRDDLWQEVSVAIFEWLQETGPQGDHPVHGADAAVFFSERVHEAERVRVLFGEKYDYEGRRQRRESLMDHLFERGYEPVPATMAPPYRGLRVDERPEAQTVDSAGRVWLDYTITRPEPMSRVFGPLTRYQLYERLDGNRDWAIDFAHPREQTWEYVCRQYAQVQDDFDFDFMRGDMSHVQMRPGGVPAETDDRYDLHRAVKEYIRKRVPRFGYFAESFLAPPNYMAYGDEVAHLDASHAEATLGNLQSMVPGEPEFNETFDEYERILRRGGVAPSFTTMTADKDDPRFDKFYLHANEARLFASYFLTDWPSYHALGFEQRDSHPSPYPNEYYTKLYVFQIQEGPKATIGTYRWGRNFLLFSNLTQIRTLADILLPELGSATTLLLHRPTARPGGLIVWTQESDPRYLFAANFSTSPVKDLSVSLPGSKRLAGLYWHQTEETLEFGQTGSSLDIDHLSGGGVVVWKLA